MISSMRTRAIITNSLVETQHVAYNFAKHVTGGHTILLSGDLGSGKTSFTQGLAKAFGIQQRIISPSFIILRKYAIATNADSIHDFYHIDLYRIQNEDEIKDLGIEDILQNSSALTVIEWPEKLGRYMPKSAWQLQLTYLDENKRKITIQKI